MSNAAGRLWKKIGRIFTTDPLIRYRRDRFAKVQRRAAQMRAEHGSR